MNKQEMQDKIRSWYFTNIAHPCEDLAEVLWEVVDRMDVNDRDYIRPLKHEKTDK